ncbi:hypothetical protein RhiirC2_781752 [Rhizophagus irregularis]|uniref:Uncharacterized protein n=1 Tax=Rhizophagus irregularis TaxID=588596 RepID=A0A2N1N4K1_9GLOM|nr:hypothetical protein RhiirC2_781752 [Rhizophagus irregularis]
MIFTLDLEVTYLISKRGSVLLENAIFKNPIYKEEKEIYLPRKGISFIKQLAYKNKKPYKRYEGSTPIQYQIIYSQYREDDLEYGIRKAETFMKRRVRGLVNNKKAVLKEVYIRSSDLVRLYSNVNSKQCFNDLNDKIILNHTYDEDDFAMIKSFKEEQLPAVRVPTDEDYRRVEHLYTKSKLTLKK